MSEEKSDSNEPKNLRKLLGAAAKAKITTAASPQEPQPWASAEGSVKAKITTSATPKEPQPASKSKKVQS